MKENLLILYGHATMTYFNGSFDKFIIQTMEGYNYYQKKQDKTTNYTLAQWLSEQVQTLNY